MPLFPQRTRLRLAFACAALLAQTLAPKIPAFDTSHLIYSHNHYDISSKYELGSKIEHPNGQLELNKSLLDVPHLTDSTGLRWDALHYQSIALHGSYAYEHQYAFSLGVPVILRLVHLGKERLSGVLELLRVNEHVGSYTLDASMMALKVLLIAALASEPCLELYSLTTSITHSHEFAYLSLIVFIMKGAPPVVFRNAYAEPFFAYFSFKGMRSCHHRAYLTAATYFALATCFRSNGIILVGFILYDLLVRPVLEFYISVIKNAPTSTQYGSINILVNAVQQVRIHMILYAVFLSTIVIAPFAAHQYLAYITFCVGSEAHPNQDLYPRPWCSSRIPSIYSFVQSHYWDVGFMRYWTTAQIPNFLLAGPILALVGGSSVMFLHSVYRNFNISSSNTPQKPNQLSASFTIPSTSLTIALIPYGIHALALSLMLFTTAHVQIALRVLPAATPWVSWAGAVLIMAGVADRRKEAETRNIGDLKNSEDSEDKSQSCSMWTLVSRIWIRWSVVWMFVSSILWLAFLPPA